MAGIAGLDAVSHAVESYVTTRRNPVSQLYAREAWRLLSSNLPIVLDDPGEVGAWGRMLLGAHLAGAAIEQSMLGAAHACANPLTARFPIPHGIAVALMLPHVIRFNAGHVGRQYDDLRLAADPAAPPELPPGVCSRFQGLRHGPSASGSVMPMMPNSGVFDRHMNRKPALRSRATSVESKEQT